MWKQQGPVLLPSALTMKMPLLTAIHLCLLVSASSCSMPSLNTSIRPTHDTSAGYCHSFALTADTFSQYIFFLFLRYAVQPWKEKQEKEVDQDMQRCMRHPRAASYACLPEGKSC